MAEKNKGKEPPVFLSTHPSSAKRIENLNNWKSTITLIKKQKAKSKIAQFSTGAIIMQFCFLFLIFSKDFLPIKSKSFL